MNLNEEEIEKQQNTNNEEFERLLIVEDNLEVRGFIKELFADDYEVSEAENGKIAFEKAIETNPQLIISDIMMPVMDGIELCKQIKTDARTSHIPVILLTARTALTFKYEGLETGADDYITKPFSARFLSLRVKNLIQQRKTIQEHFKREAICDPGSITVTSVDEKILKKAVDYITENISDPSINVNKISAHVGLSRVHFYRKIKALTNQTAVEFIRNVKLKRAATLLSQDKLSVKEVRNMVGFEDADYFRECFKNQFGVSPSEYS
jgi:DNA-binding response OmpR family regulator